MENRRKIKFRILFAIATFLLAVQLNSYAQERFIVSDESKVVVKGTSSLHDWVTDVTEINGGGIFALGANAIESANNFHLSMPVKSMASGKKGMDNKIYEALKADKSPMIEFQYKNISQQSPGKITVNGKMTIAGKSKDVQLVSDYAIINGNIIIKGVHSMKMTEFEVDPPTAMLGAVRAGDQIQIEYNLVLLNHNNLTSK
jgi:hypothetical protein